MPKTAKEVMDLYYGMKDAVNLANILESVTIFFEDREVAEQLNRYGKSLKNLALAKNKKDAQMVQQCVNDLEGLSAFLEKNYAHISSFININDKQRKNFERSVFMVDKILGIPIDYEKITGESYRITVDGVSYTRQEFRNRMYENHWERGKDDKAIDLFFDGYYAAESSNEANAKKMQDGERIMRSLLSDSIDTSKPATGRHKHYNDFGLWQGMEFDLKLEVDALAGGIRQDILRENHEDEKAKMLAQAGGDGWSTEKEQSFLALLFDCRFDINGKFNDTINDNLSDIRRKGKSLADRKKFLKQLQGNLENIPEDQRSEKQKEGLTALSDYTKRLDEAYAFADKVMGQDVWFDNILGKKEGEELLSLMHYAADRLPADVKESYNKQLEVLAKGEKSGSFTQIPLSKGKKGALAALQTEAEYNKAAQLLRDSKSNDPFVQRTILEIDKHVRVIRESDAYKQQSKLKDGLMEWIGFTEEKISALNVFCDKMGKLSEENKLTGPASEKAQMLMVQARYIGVISSEKIRNDEEAKSIVQSLDSLKKDLPDFVGNLGLDHAGFEAGLNFVKAIVPEKAEGVTLKAKEIFEEKAKEENRVRSNKIYEQRMEELEILRYKLGKVEKAYFGHINTSQYKEMVGALNDALKAKDLNELVNKQTTLADRANTYLLRSGTGKASSLHPNSEIRRLCAFDLLNICGDQRFAQRAEEGNKERMAEEQITAERLKALRDQDRQAAKDAKNDVEKKKTATNLAHLIEEENKTNPKKTDKKNEVKKSVEPKGHESVRKKEENVKK